MSEMDVRHVCVCVAKNTQLRIAIYKPKYVSISKCMKSMRVQSRDESACAQLFAGGNERERQGTEWHTSRGRCSQSTTLPLESCHVTDTKVSSHGRLCLSVLPWLANSAFVRVCTCARGFACGYCVTVHVCAKCVTVCLRHRRGFGAVCVSTAV